MLLALFAWNRLIWGILTKAVSLPWTAHYYHVICYVLFWHSSSYCKVRFQTQHSSFCRDFGIVSSYIVNLSGKPHTYIYLTSPHQPINMSWMFSAFYRHYTTFYREDDLTYHQLILSPPLVFNMQLWVGPDERLLVVNASSDSRWSPHSYSLRLVWEDCLYLQVIKDLRCTVHTQSQMWGLTKSPVRQEPIYNLLTL